MEWAMQSLSISLVFYSSETGTTLQDLVQADKSVINMHAWS
jgi:hypothetical protein